MKIPIALCGLVSLVLTGAAFGASVSRSFHPAAYTPGQVVTVTLTVSATGAVAQAVEDNAPAGWTVSSASDGGNAAGGRAAWFFLDGKDRTLTYQATAPVGESGPKAFSGEGAFDGEAIAIGGSGTIAPAGSAVLKPPEASAGRAGSPSERGSVTSAQ